MTNKLLALYGLKWNPFSPDVPVEALWRSPQGEHFCWRMESLVREGGFALITGDPGTGKSVALRILAAHLASGAPQRGLASRLALIHWHEHRDTKSDRSRPRGVRRSTSSTAALWRSRALARRSFSRLRGVLRELG